MADIYRSPLFTIKQLLKNGVIPFIVLDYSSKSLKTLTYNYKNFIVAETEYTGFSIALKGSNIYEDDVDDILLDTTKLKVDYNYITPETFYELLEPMLHIGEIVRSKSIKIDSKGKTFSEDDFTVLIRLANKAKQDADFWET